MTELELGYVVMVWCVIFIGMMFSMFANIDKRLKKLEK